MIELDGFYTAVRTAFGENAGPMAPYVKYYLSVVLIFWPAMRIIERLGRNVMGTLLLFVPLLGFTLTLVWLACGRTAKADVARAGEA